MKLSLSWWWFLFDWTAQCELCLSLVYGAIKKRVKKRVERTHPIRFQPFNEPFISLFLPLTFEKKALESTSLILQSRLSQLIITIKVPNHKRSLKCFCICVSGVTWLYSRSSRSPPKSWCFKVKWFSLRWSTLESIKSKYCYQNWQVFLSVKKHFSSVNLRIIHNLTVRFTRLLRDLADLKRYPLSWVFIHN